MKKLLIFTFLPVLILCITFSGCSDKSANTESDETEMSDASTHSFVEGHGPIWNEAIEQLMELADAMPEEDYSFAPHDSVRTFAEQLVHIAGSSKVIANMFLKDIQPEGPPADVDVSAMSKEEVKGLLRTSLGETWEIMASMSDEQLTEGIKSFSGNDMTRLEGLLLVHDHLTNHKAKANLYVRISGNEPPGYRYY